MVTFGASDSFGTSEYALLEGKPFPNLTEVRNTLLLNNNNNLIKYLKSYSPTVTHDKIFVYEFCVS